MTVDLAIPGAMVASDPSSIESMHPNGHDLIVIGVFGSATGDKEKFFRTVCEVPPESNTNNIQIPRGVTTINGTKAHIFNFPNLYEGEWIQDSDTLFQIVHYLAKYTEGRLRGIVYIRGHSDNEEEQRSMRLFESLVGDEAIQDSVLVLEPPSFQQACSHFAPPDSTLVHLSDDSAETYFNILSQLVHRNPFTTRCQKEVAQKLPLSKTAVGQLLDSYLVEDEFRITSARARLQGKEIGPQDSPSTPTNSPRARQRTSSDITRELEAARNQIRRIEADYVVAREQLAAQGASLPVLEETNEQLQLRNEELEQIVQDLRFEAEHRHVLATQSICVQTDFTLSPPPEPLPTTDEILALHSEISSLQSSLANTSDEKTALASEINRVSAELATTKSEINELKSSNAELEKKANGLEKKADSLQKKCEGMQTKHDALDKKSKELEKEKETLAKDNKTANAAQARLKPIEDKLNSAEGELKKFKKELEALQKKQAGLEKERQQAIGVSEGILKSNEFLKKELETAKGQAENVQKQAKGKVSELQKTIEEKSVQIEEQRGQLKDIASAAGAWAAASAEVERLKECMQTERVQAEARYETSQAQVAELQNTLRTERDAWEAERDWGTNELRRLELANSTLGMKLKGETMLREVEVEGYCGRISELEEWGQSRWDAVGSSCVIA